MRLKLVIISSLVAAIVGAGSAIAIILSVFSSLKPIASPGLLVLSTYLLPMLYDCVERYVRLSPHRAPAEVAGNADRNPRSAADNRTFRSRLNFYFQNGTMDPQPGLQRNAT